MRGPSASNEPVVEIVPTCSVECAEGMSLELEVSGPGLSLRTRARVRVATALEALSPGTYTATLQGFGWRRRTQEFTVPRGVGARIEVPVLPELVISARLTNARTRLPISRFRARQELRLFSGGTHVGSPEEHADASGRYCAIPIQAADALRIIFEADGYRPTTTDWLPGVGSTDLGTLGLDPADPVELELRVHDATSAHALAGVDLVVVPVNGPPPRISLFASHLSVEREAAEDDLQEHDEIRSTTDASGSARVEVPSAAAYRIAAWKVDHRLQVLDVSRGPVEIVLEAGNRVLLEAYFAPASLRTVRRLTVELDGPDGNLRRELPLDADRMPLTCALAGIPDGPCRLRLVTQQARAHGNGRLVVAAAEFTAQGSQELRLCFDCGVGILGGTISGSASLPAEAGEVDLQAFDASPTETDCARRATAVEAGTFRLTDIQGPTRIGLCGSDRDGDCQVFWFSEPAEPGADLGTIELGQRCVVGDAGGSALQWNEVHVVPTGERALPPLLARGVDVYPDNDGTFRIYGLPPGDYRATANEGQLAADFRVPASGLVRVTLGAAQRPR